MTWRQHRIVDGAGGAMSELRDVRQMLELAERAAINSDFSSADELLRDVARIQEAETGPVHPDLANTLNSLAIVAEKTGRFAEAESFYRRSAAIASESLPANHPIVAESRKNLEDFCRERGVPLAPSVLAAVTTLPAQDPAVGLDAFVAEAAADAKESAAPARNAKTGISKPSEPPSSSGKPSLATRAVAAPAPMSFPPAKRRSWRQVAWMPIAAIVLVAVAVLMRQPSTSRTNSTTAEMSPVIDAASPPPPTSPSASPPTPPAEQTALPEDSDRRAGTEQPSTAAPSSGSISLATGQICQTFSTDRDGWQCEPPGETVAGGPIVFYTRVRSPRDAEVVHRWYHGDMLRQTVRLTIRANVSEGYRTYSRHLLDRVGDWRVEATSDAGDVLYEQRFTVR
jgi:hypothetical protein